MNNLCYNELAFVDAENNLPFFNVDGKIVAVMVRGDREVNEVKVSNAIGSVIDFEMASPEEVYKESYEYEKAIVQ